jgi:hypothetical protein
VATLMIRMFAGRKHVLQLTAGRIPRIVTRYAT